jgi:glutamate-1-semialdehyde 2,1-aminomutase
MHKALDYRGRCVVITGAAGGIGRGLAQSFAAAGATLELLEVPGFHTRLEESTRRLTEGLEQAAREAGVAFTTNGVAGMFGLFFSASARVSTYADVKACDVARFQRFFHEMLQRGVYLAPSAFEAGFISSAHGEEEIQHTLDAARASFAAVR